MEQMNAAMAENENEGGGENLEDDEYDLNMDAI